MGTPAIKGDADKKQINLVIDGVEISVAEGTSIMRAAREIGRNIPKLCATDSLEAFGSCRLCLVEIEGAKGTPASCTTPVKEGMKVTTKTPRLEKIRKGVMELYLSDHPLECLTCAVNGDCELQDVAGEVGVRQVRYGYKGENHFDQQSADPVDQSNPYFQFDATKCIVCSRCVRACDEVQGTLALAVQGRGFGSIISAGLKGEDFFASECVSCGACVSVCPTAALVETAVVEHGVPTRSVATTCAYCGVGCSFIAQLQGDEVIRMIPDKNGGANEGHSCVKGRFAFGYASHKDRITTPMVREKTTDPWQQVSWDEALEFAAKGFMKIKEKYGNEAIGGITSSRCTNEEVFAVQKMIRGAFGSNNVDTCARVCHAPTGYGLKTTFGTSAGTQDFKSVEKTDVILLIGANPTDGHPVFASRMKKRLREGAKLIVIDPRRIDLVRSPLIEAQYHIPLQPGTNVAVLNAFAHVALHENLLDKDFINERCDNEAFANWKEFIELPSNSPQALSKIIGVEADILTKAARLFASAKNGAIYYGLGVTEHSQGSTTVMAMANLAMATGNIGREGVGVNPLRGQNNVQGSCDMGSFPHEFSGYRSVEDDQARAEFETDWGVPLSSKPGLRLPNMFEGALNGSYRGMFIQGEDIAQSDPNTKHVTAALEALDCLVVQDLFLNETAAYAHVFLPGTSFLEKDGTFTNAERRINRVRPAMKEKCNMAEWEVAAALATKMGFAMHYDNSAQIMDEIARLTPSFELVSHARLDEVGSLQWPANNDAPNGTEIMHADGFVRGKGLFVITEFIATTERSSRKFPLILTTGRILSQYNVGAQTRRTQNNKWHEEDVLEIHPHDAEQRGINNGDMIEIASRMGDTSIRAVLSERMSPGIVYTTFHHPLSGTNVITTENSDWATNCPEYKVTAVQVKLVNQLSGWQNEQREIAKSHYKRSSDKPVPAE
ncbi:MAG: formate dehydrogenase subunit alpha [Devosiaceae bacterium]|nr:formate dehydrogenase subunit alpha [Devosiaceae bacterium]